MFELALKAELPLIQIDTNDLVNLKEILTFIVKKPVVPLSSEEACKINSMTFSKNRRYFFMVEPSDDVPYVELYQQCIAHEIVVILINPEHVVDVAFNAGTLTLPEKLLHNFLDKIVARKHLKKIKINQLKMALHGLTLKDIAEITRLCIAQSGTLSTPDILAIRKFYLKPLQGLTQVNTQYTYYKAPLELLSWVACDGHLFLSKESPAELIPRGLMFGGPSGTGKTLSAKYLANALSVPLYRLDLASILGKFVGDSEHNLSRALIEIERKSPCVVLLDEIEKLFTQNDTSNTTTKLLSQLLWWMQEHRFRVLTIFTSNNVEAVPEELYRTGRIDQVIMFKGLRCNEAPAFCRQVLKTFKHAVPKIDFTLIQLEINRQFKNVKRIPQSQMTQLVYNVVKHIIVTNLLKT